MGGQERLFNIEKSFGMGVLFKLIKKHLNGIEITTDGKRFSSNVSLNELSRTVDNVLAIYNIRLKVA